MDALKAEIAKKRQLLQAAVSNSNGSTAEDQQPAFKYVKRSALDEVSRQRNISTKPAASSTDAASINEPADQIKKRSAKGDQTLVDGTESDQDDEKYKNIPDEELRRRFRAFGEPVRLFGETHKQRVRRLKALEMNQEQTDGQRNVFMSHVSQVDSELQMQDLLKQSMHSTAGINSVPGNGASETASGKASEDQRSKKEQVFAKYETEFELIDMKLAQQDKNRCCELIYVFLKKLLHEWGEQLDRRPDDVKRTAKGKSDTITHRQTQDYMKPLFRMLKGKTVEIDVLAHVANICELAFHREYIKANEAYLRLSIGNAPWPIGVTGVNIHERSAQDRIKSNTVAHVLNDETQRKWVQSIKRLLTFSQQKYPPEDFSKLMGGIFRKLLQMANKMSSALPAEVFALILHHLLPPLSGDFESFVACGLLNRNDEVGRKTLYQCMLANRGMLIEARRILWRNLQLNISGSNRKFQSFLTRYPETCSLIRHANVIVAVCDIQALLLKFPNIKTLELRLGWLTELSTSGNVRRLSVDKPKLKALRLIGLYEIDELEALLAVFGETLEYLRLDTSDPNPIVKLPEALVSSLSNDALIQAIGASNMALDYGPTIHEQLISSSEQLVGRHCRNLKKLIINEKEIY